MYPKCSFRSNMVESASFKFKFHQAFFSNLNEANASYVACYGI